ncbi:tigger transposable element-derived protein 1 [Trichonephila clavipes]|nr:tigger transposable element-derived protein 1 [Trichonephila clavipes]
MPTRTYIAKSEKTASGFKAAKDRVTLLLCSNASGDRMLKPLLVNRSLKPRALKGKDLNTLPVHWMANKKAWVTTAIFTEWFNKCFVPEVENYMNEMGLEFKILLILDNAPAIAEIKSQTLNACWKAAWPECVSKGNESNRAIVTSEIISIAKEIGGEGFDDFGEHDIEELLVDEALNDDDILESMVDITKDLETVDSEPEEDVTPLDEKLLREGLQLSVPEEALPCRSDDVILSSSDESDLAPIHKRGVGVATVAEWYRYRILACFATSSSPVPLKTRRVGQRCTLNLSRAETSSRWCGVVVSRGGASSGVVHFT